MTGDVVPTGEAGVSLVATTFNEIDSIDEWLDGVVGQIRQPDEIVIVDGGSTDGTIDALKRRAATEASLRVVVEPGANISRGRNVAISHAQGPLIAITDAGTVMDRDWLEALVAPLEDDAGIGVSAGFFRPGGRTALGRLIAAVITPRLPEITPADFLPSSRSVALRKEWWERVGGYPEWLRTCEDLVFDMDMRDAGARFAFAPGAIVTWSPPATLRGFFRQYRGYARGDREAGLWAKRHAARYGAYATGVVLLAASSGGRRLWPRLVLTAGLASYMRKFAWRVSQEAPWGEGPPTLAVIAAVPAIVAVGDVAKMIGYAEARRSAQM